MNNDLSRITEDTPECDLPYLIWYPHWANRSAYQALAHRRPSIRPQAARACIVADSQDVYDSIKLTPDWCLVEEAQTRAGSNPYYLEDLQLRAEDMGADISEPTNDCIDWKVLDSFTINGMRTTVIPYSANPGYAPDWEQREQYNGTGGNMSGLELLVSVTEEMRTDKRNGCQLDVKQLHLENVSSG